MAVIVFLTAFLICQAQSQICPGSIFPGTYCDPFIPNIPPPYPCGPPLLNTIPPVFTPPCNNYVNPVLPCAQPVLDVPVVPSFSPCATTVTSPVVATTVVDNTLANSLANAIQLLIVSNLIENTLGSSNNAILSSCLGIPDTYEVINQDFCQSPIIYDSPCQPFPSFEPLCYQEPIIYQNYEPCNNCGYGIDYGCGFDKCGCGSNFIIDNCNPCNQIGPYGLPYGDLAIAPMAVEVPFPSAIPAQLLCNFGYMPANVPCVSVNVEPLPFDPCGCNPFGNVFY